MPFSERKKAKRRKYYLENLAQSVSNSKESYNKNRDTVKARTSSYRKERRRVNPVKERVASSQSMK